jgi:rhodanese-related sulfurtransferase
MRIALFAVSVFVAATVFAEDNAATKSEVRNVKPDEFEKLSKEKDAVILDVRTPKEYADGHIAGAVNVDWNSKDFAEKVGALDKSKTYLVHCAVGGRSARACEKLSKMEFPHLYNLEGGITAWQREGKTVERGEK